MSFIQVSDLTFYYDGSYDNIFEHVSFRIDTDWKLALVGRNGRGKTTFLNLLLGKYEYQGSIVASETFDYFPFPVNGTERCTVDLLEEIAPDFQLWQIIRELSLLETDSEILYRPFCTLSNGEQTKVLLALLFSREHRFLLIDEPTNHLDAPARAILCRYLSQKSGFILVSHDRNFLDGCVDHVLAINKQNITVTKGNFSVWWENKQTEDASEQARNELLKKDIRRLTEAFDRTKTWSDDVEKSKIGNHSADRGYIGHKSAKMMKRAKSMEHRSLEAIEEKSSLLLNIETADSLKLFPQRHHKDLLVHMEGISIQYDNRTVLEHFHLDIRNGDRIVLSGSNGCGKSSILKTILGEYGPHSGIIETARGLIISYVAQDTSSLKGSLEEYAGNYKLDLTLFQTMLRKLDFSREQFGKRMEDYSGGQKKKVLLARSLCEKAHLYLWDEPLNFIDIFSRMQIESLILQAKPTMVLVEHDSFFTNSVGTTVRNLTDLPCPPPHAFS